MYTDTARPPSGRIGQWFRNPESWLDARGRGAWIAAMVLGFIFVWPVGLMLLAYMIYASKFSSGRRFASRHDHEREHQMFCRHKRAMGRVHHSSGNTAFDSYKAETLKRLEEEQEQFESFLARLREAKDKSEFDRFMDDRAREASAPRPEAEAGDAPRAGAY